MQLPCRQPPRLPLEGEPVLTGPSIYFAPCTIQDGLGSTGSAVCFFTMKWARCDGDPDALFCTSWSSDGVHRSWPELDDIRGKVLFVLVDKYGKYGPMYRTLFPGLRNGTFFVSQPGEGTH